MGKTLSKEETVIVQNAAGGSNNASLEELRLHLSAISVLVIIILLLMITGAAYLLFRIYKKCHVRWINQELCRSSMAQFQLNGNRRDGGVV